MVLSPRLAILMQCVVFLLDIVFFVALVIVPWFKLVALLDRKRMVIRNAALLSASLLIAGLSLLLYLGSPSGARMPWIAPLFFLAIVLELIPVAVLCVGYSNVFIRSNLMIAIGGSVEQGLQQNPWHLSKRNIGLLILLFVILALPQGIILIANVVLSR